jgi:hypothetical protein
MGSEVLLYVQKVMASAAMAAIEVADLLSVLSVGNGCRLECKLLLAVLIHEQGKYDRRTARRARVAGVRDMDEG